MRTFLFYGLADEPISAIADNLDAAVGLVEAECAIRMLPAPAGGAADEIIVTSLGEPDENRFQHAKFEGAFLVTTSIQ
jgi:hypothetical protein